MPRIIFSSDAAGHVQGACLNDDLDLLTYSSQYCLPVYDRIRRLAAHYGPRLQIVLVATTHGNAIRSLPLSTQQEVERIRWYFLDYLKLPVTLAVIERPIKSVPAPDGRQYQRSLCSQGPKDPDSDMSVAACKYLRFPGVVMLDRHGRGGPLYGTEAAQKIIIDHRVSQ
jgi:hypothetical protein